MFGKKEQKPPTEKQIIGKIGEDYACDYLRNNGYKIIDRNYLKKWGELDIVAKKGGMIHFVEVKSVSRFVNNTDVTCETLNSVIRETPVVEQSSLRGKHDDYRPEDNMHPWKLKRLGRAVQSYLLEKDISDDVDWQFDIATVYIDKDKKPRKIFLLEDIVL